MSTWTTIRYYQTAVDAHYARCLLEAEGIPVFLRDEHTVATNPLWGVTVGGIKLQVPFQWEAIAIDLLTTREHESFQEGSHTGVVADEPAPRCASCGGHDLEGPYTTLRTGSGWMGFLLGAVLASYPMGLDRIYRCRSCGARTPLTEYGAPGG